MCDSRIQRDPHSLSAKQSPCPPAPLSFVPLQTAQGLSTYTQSLVNTLNTLAGIGTLSFPYALWAAGWGGLLIILLCAGLCCYTALLLGTIMRASPIISAYPDIGALIFGSWGLVFVGLAFVVELFLVLVSFVLLLADSLHQLAQPYATHDTCFAIAVAILVPSAYIQSLGRLTALSCFGLFSALVLLLALGYEALAAPAAAPGGAARAHQVVNWHTLPLGLGIVMLGFAGHSLFPSICAHMRDPAQYFRLSKTAFAVSTLYYLVVAAAGYALYGACTQSEITANLVAGPAPHAATRGHTTGPMAYVALLTVIVIPVSKFGLYCTLLCVAIEGWFADAGASARRAACRMAGVRTALVAAVVTVAFAVPDFAGVVSFAGAGIGMLISTTFPLVCYLKFWWNGLSRAAVAGHIALVLFSLVLSVYGVLGSVGIYVVPGDEARCDAQ